MGVDRGEEAEQWREMRGGRLAGSLGPSVASVASCVFKLQRRKDIDKGTYWVGVGEVREAGAEPRGEGGKGRWSEIPWRSGGTPAGTQ